MDYRATLHIWTLCTTDHCDASISVYFQAESTLAAFNKAWELLADYTWKGTPVSAYRKYSICVTCLTTGQTFDC